MPTLTQVYNGLDRENKPYDIQLVDPPSYLKTLGVLQQRIIFAYKQGICSSGLPRSMAICGSSSLKRKDAKSVRELIGTPLEDNCEIDIIDDSILNMNLNDYRAWTDEEEDLLPIPLDDGRYLINQVNRFSCSSGSCWVLCESFEEPNTLMMQFEFSNEWHSRGIVNFTGLLPYSAIDISKLLQKHSSYFIGSLAISTQIQTQFTIQPFLIMQLSWTTTSLVPSLTSYRNADIMLYQTVRIGSNSSVSDDYWRQLMRLDLIKEQIVAYKEEPDRHLLVYSSGSNLSINTIKDGIFKILSDVMPIVSSSDYSSESPELESVITLSLKREMVDITDQLWVLLKLCSSYEDLNTAFSYIFQCAAKCNVVIESKNRLAELIRDISQKRFAVPSLNGVEPLELLLEIGLEKATKDYEFIFTESHICSAKDLLAQPIVNRNVTDGKTAATNRQTMRLRNQQIHDDEPTDGGSFQNSTFNRTKSENKLAKLAQIHLLMEHLLLIQIHLNWSDMKNYVLEDLKRSPKPFSILKTQFHDKREIPILCSQVINKVESCEPNVLKIVMQSSHKFSQIQNTFVYSTSPIFPINIFPMMQNEEKDPASPPFYCGVHYLKISSLKKPID